MRDISGFKMAGLLSLRVSQLSLQSIRTPLRGNCLCLVPKNNTSLGCVRQMGHKRTMKIKVTNFEWEEWKDNMHFWTFVVLAPMAVLIASVNIFVGHAELADIPEGYEPKFWEYYKHPISRWLVRNFFWNHEKTYEANLHVLDFEQKKMEMRVLEKKVRRLMSDQDDYYGWYYIPPTERFIYRSANINQKEMENL